VFELPVEQRIWCLSDLKEPSEAMANLPTQMNLRRSPEALDMMDACRMRLRGDR